MTMNAPDKGFNRNNTCRYIPCYDNEMSFLYLTHSPVLWQWGVIPILDTQSSLITMRCHSYTWHTVQSYNNEVSFLYLTHSQSYDNEVSCLYLTLIPFLWQWGVIPILDTQPSLMSMRCPSYTWHTAQFYDNEVSFLYLTLSPHSYDIEVSFLYLTLSPSLMTMKCHSYTWHSSHSYDNEVSFLYLTLIPVLCQWGVLPILDT
jgi:hypothetical protein